MPWLELWFTPQFRSTERETVRRYRKMLLSTPPEGYAWCCEAIGELDLRENIRAIEAPTLVLVGSEDPAIAFEDAELLGARIPNVRVSVLHRAAHLANVEQPEAFSHEVLTHIGSEAVAP